MPDRSNQKNEVDNIVIERAANDSESRRRSGARLRGVATFCLSALFMVRLIKFYQRVAADQRVEHEATDARLKLKRDALRLAIFLEKPKEDRFVADRIVAGESVRRAKPRDQPNGVGVELVVNDQPNRPGSNLGDTSRLADSTTFLARFNQMLGTTNDAVKATPLGVPHRFEDRSGLCHRA